MIRALELSRKIYESGFEPDMMARSSKGSTNIYLTIGKPDMQEDIKSFFNIYPWFSADWCWKMLPYKINLHELQTDGVCSEVGYRYYYLDRDDKISCDDLVAFKINDSLHEALLELVYWCIDNKYLIPSNKGELKGKI